MSLEQDMPDLAELFVAHRAQLCRAAQRIVGTPELAEEVAHDAYLKVSELTGAFHVKQPVAYCFQIVRNLAIDQRRRMSLEMNVFVDEENGAHVPTTQGTPEQLAIDRQHLQIVDRVLAALPARTRQAFELYRLSGLTQRDIARSLGVSATLVNFMIREATDALMDCRHLLGKA